MWVKLHSHAIVVGRSGGGKKGARKEGRKVVNVTTPSRPAFGQGAGNRSSNKNNRVLHMLDFPAEGGNPVTGRVVAVALSAFKATLSSLRVFCGS